MARYLIGTALTLRGTVKKNQPADKFRKILLKQRVSFSERSFIPGWGDLKNNCWDLERKSWAGVILPTHRERIDGLMVWPVTEFTFEDQGEL